MGINEQEALARQLYKIHEEALGTGKDEWELESPAWREAWIQVAQFVEGRDSHDESDKSIDYSKPNKARDAYFKNIRRKEFDEYPDHK